MKRLFIILSFIVLLSGCARGEEFTCHVGDKEVKVTMNDGLITSYQTDGEKLSAQEIDELNGTYFTSATTNEDGKRILDSYINNMGGMCD